MPMITIVSWNISKRRDPWHKLVEMEHQGNVDVALLQEAGDPHAAAGGRV